MQVNPAYIFTPYFSKIYFNIILSFFRFPDLHFVYIFHLLDACYRLIFFYFLQYLLLYFQNAANDSVVNGVEAQTNGHNDSSAVKEPPRKKARKQ